MWNNLKTVANVTSAAPTGAIPGDIYKCVFQITSSQIVNTWAGSVTPTASNMLQYGASNRTLILDDGSTFYLGYNVSASLALYPTLEAAVTNTDAIEWQQTLTAVSFGLCASIQLVRNTTDLTQSAY